jgi:hypothetical protein
VSAEARSPIAHTPHILPTVCKSVFGRWESGMPQIAIADTTLARLQKHAVPLLDTFDTVINRVFDAYETHNGDGSHTAVNPTLTARAFAASSPPDLTHTKVLSAKLEGSPLGKGANWNGLLKQAVRLATRSAKKRR